MIKLHTDIHACTYARAHTHTHTHTQTHSRKHTHSQVNPQRFWKSSNPWKKKQNSSNITRELWWKLKQEVKQRRLLLQLAAEVDTILLPTVLKLHNYWNRTSFFLSLAHRRFQRKREKDLFLFISISSQTLWLYTPNTHTCIYICMYVYINKYNIIAV